MKYFIKSLVVLFFTFTSLMSGHTLYSQTLNEKIDECKKFKVSLIRLQCYDRISDEKGTQSVKKSKRRLFDLGGDKNKADKSDNANTARKVDETVEEEKSSVASNPENSFGKTQDLSEPEEINSRILGIFNGWSGETTFELENGQVWKKTGNGFLSANVNNPKINIKKGALGSFTLSVEGFNSSIKVKRIK
ncbi:MAG: hypothetical protein P8L74_00500 [Gammaproteobacteria bacterium]|mgnify:FL=1|jgi:hypothetical protein|nr:hypothetical protein [Gammaproteobacteria bacterium]